MIEVVIYTLLSDVGDIWDTNVYQSQIISASIRSSLNISQSLKYETNIFTVPYKVLMQA